MKKLFLVSILSILSFGAFAEDMPQPPMDFPKGEKIHHKKDMMANLTEEQKACIEKFGCKMPEKPEMKEDMPPMEKPAPDAEKPDDKKRPEMTEERKEAMDCMKNAMKECNIPMPERPEGQKPKHPHGDKPERQENDN